MQTRVTKPPRRAAGAGGSRAKTWEEPATLVAQLMDLLAVGVADTADADQWLIEAGGLRRTGVSGFDHLVPHDWLISLNHGRPAIYEISLPLEADDRHLGFLRLSTWRPTGFLPGELHHARRRADLAAQRLVTTLP